MNGRQWIGIIFFGGGIISILYLLVRTTIFTSIIAILVGIIISIGVALLMYSEV